MYLPEPSHFDSVDWNGIWNKRMLACQGTDAAQKYGGQWQSRESALEYWEMVQNTQKRRIEKTLAELPLTPQSRILDIGSGPGVMAIPLARKVAHVTAVDVSEAMIAVLKEKAVEEGLGNIKCLCKPWESVNPLLDLGGPYDVIVASLCLTMFDLQLAVKKMESACDGYIYLYWFTGETSWESQQYAFEPFMSDIKQTRSLPKCDLLLKVLQQKGVYPNMKTFPYLHLDWFDSIDTALEYFLNRFKIPPTHQSEALRDYVSNLLEKRKGKYLLKSEATCMKVWWPSFNKSPAKEVLCS